MIIDKALEQGIRLSILPLEVLKVAKDYFGEFINNHKLSDYQKNIINNRYVFHVPDEVDFTPKSVAVAVWDGKISREPVAVDGFFTEMGINFYDVSWIPKKYLATKAGMGEFGRNNLVFFENWGSYGRIGTYLTDIESPSKFIWEDARVMSACNTCGKCAMACPGKTMQDDRFLMYAERCINIGRETKVCARCMEVCPINQRRFS